MTIEDTMVNKEKAGELKRILEKVFHERCGLPVEILFDYVEPVRAKASIERENYARREAERMTAKVAPILGLRLAGQGENGQGTDKAWSEVPWEDGSGKTGQTLSDGLTLENAGAAGANNGVGSQAGQMRQEGKNAGQTGKNMGSEGKISSGNVSGPDGGLRGGRKSGFKKSDWSTGGGYRKKSDNPDVLYGRDFEDNFIEIDKIEGEIGEITIRGKILDRDSRLLRSGKTIFIFDVTDFTDTITVKMFADEASLEDMDKATKAGSFIQIGRAHV